MSKLIEKFKPFVNGYVGSSMLTDTEYPEAILANAEKCAEVSNQNTIDFLKWLEKEDFSFYQEGLIRHRVKEIVLLYEQVLNIYEQTL